MLGSVISTLSFTSLLLLFIISFLVYKWCFSSLKRPGRNLPPSPRKLPIIGNLHQLDAKAPHRSLHALAQTHGPLMLLHFGKSPALIASSAEVAREIMKTHDVIFSNRVKAWITKKLFYGPKDVAFVEYGEYWRQVRSIVVLRLLSNKRVQSFRHVREEEARILVERIVESGGRLPVNLSELLSLMMDAVICRVVLGRRYDGRRFKEMTGRFMQVIGTFSVGDYIPWLSWVDRLKGLDVRVDRVAAEFDEFLEGAIEEHLEKQRDESEGQDFVDTLLQIQRENNKASEFVMGMDTIKALLLDMFAAGTHSTFTAIEWAIAELLRHPNVMKKLQNEVREIQNGKPLVTEDDIEKMDYLKAVYKETLRLHPPIALLVPRESTQDVKILGYDVQAGTQVFINTWTIGRDPLLWEDPEEFRPDRFLNRCDIDFIGSHFGFTPFGAGRRGCPGIQFAVTVDLLALASVVHKFDFALESGARGEDLDMAESSGITIHKKSPLIVMATPFKL